MSKQAKDQGQVIVSIGNVHSERLENARERYRHCDFVSALGVLATIKKEHSGEIPPVVYLGFLACLYGMESFKLLEKECQSENFSRIPESDKKLIETFWGGSNHPKEIDANKYPKTVQFFDQFPSFQQSIPVSSEIFRMP